jgi:hypothetical protein
MITGFNTDVQHDGHLYHVQTEDRGLDHPFLESLVYIGGTIVAQKLTSYGEQIDKGATEETRAGLLRRQHQVIIAAIKAGRIDELVRLTERNKSPIRAEEAAEPGPVPSALPLRNTQPPVDQPSVAASDLVGAGALDAPPSRPPDGSAVSGRLGLNLDEVVSDYLRRSSEQGKLDLKVVTPKVFVAGTSVELIVQVAMRQEPEAEAVVTVKIIGTAFKPQVYSSRADRQGTARFKFALPAFTAGTAALVIEAQSGRGRGELKHLIRRA